MHKAFSGLALLLVAAGPLVAQSNRESSSPIESRRARAERDLPGELARWRELHGPHWRLHVDGGTGTLELLAGGRAAPRFEPQGDADFETLARAALADTRAMHGADDATLELVRVLHLPLGIVGSTDKLTVRFRQAVDGVPVERGFANVLFDQHGALLSIQFTGLPDVAGFQVSPALDADAAGARALAWFAAETGLPATSVSAAELAVDQDEVDGQRAPRLAWKVDVQSHLAGTDPVGKLVFVDAGTGQAYRAEESVHFFDVSGTVTSNASPSVLPDIASNPEAQLPMAYMRVQAGAQVVFTDANGNFNLPGANAPLNVTVGYAGTYNAVNNAAGANYVLTQSLTQPSGNVVAMNPATPQEVTAQANAFFSVNHLRDWVRSVNPSDATADFVATANVMVSGSCNAVFNGSSTNYYPVAGSCVNTAYSTIVAHETGHWLNNRYGTNNGTDGMGEGNADVFAMYSYDTAVVGSNFNGSGFVRTGNNTRQFCGDADPGCHGGVHANGEVWMGAAWKVRSRLGTALGNALGDQTADALFLGWMNSYNQTQIRSIIETQWLTLDDDDGNVDNGTPHYAQIDPGFRDQGFPGVQLTTITISGVTVLADTQDELGPYVVEATLVPNQSSSLGSASVRWRLEDGSLATLPMTNVTANLWRAQIPGVTSPAHVGYYIEAADLLGNTRRFPEDAPVDVLDFDVGIVHVLRFHSFEAGSDEGWVHASVGDTSSLTDDWARGDPAGDSGTTWSDPSIGWSPSNCWGTDLGNGTNGTYPTNVHTYLRAPATDCSSATGVRLRFRRWLSVQGSGSDQARILVNGQQVWINPTTDLNDGRWLAQEIPIGAIADGNAAVQIEWRLRSNGSGNRGGWNLDDVEILWIESSLPPCPAPVNYCVTSPNTVGPGAVMLIAGSSRISHDDLTLIASGCPPGTPGLFFYGQTATQSPFGNGVRCIGGQAARLPLTAANLFGDAVFDIDYPALPQPVQSGESWRFQFWYRNPAAGGAGFNLSDGLLVTFCP